MEFAWNIVTKHIEKKPWLEKKLREKIGKLEQDLDRFPPDAVYLQVLFEGHPRKPQFTTALTLRLPAAVLRVEKTAPELVQSFDNAIKVLRREIERHKAELRHEAEWRARGETSVEREDRSANRSSLTGIGTETLAEIVRDLLKEHYPRYFRYVRRRVRRAELAGRITRGCIDPRGVLDEAARQALTFPESKPAKMSYRLWIYQLIRDELNSRYERWLQERRDTMSLERNRYLRDEQERGGDYAPERPLGIIDSRMESAMVELSGILPNPEESPEESLEHRDLLGYLHNKAHQWPEKHQHVFELHFVEGLSAFEVALVEKMPEEEVAGIITDIQARLRTLLYEETESIESTGGGIRKRSETY